MISWSKLLSNLYVQRMSFTLMGIDLEALPQASIVNRLWLLLILMFSSIYQWICVLIYLCMTEQTIAESTWTVLPWFQTTISLMKIFTVFKKARELVQLNADVNGLLDEDRVSFKARTIWLRENHRAQGYCFAYAAIAATSGLSFLMLPIIFTLVKLLMSGEFKPVVGMNTMTPYDQSKPIFFTLEYLLLVGNVFIAATATIGVDTLFFWYTSNISGHFRIVIQQLEELAEVFDNMDDEVYSWQTYENENIFHRFEQSLKGMLHYHKKTLHLATRFAKTFREFILWEVSINCLLFSSIVCQYLMSENLKQNIFFLNTFISTIFIQLIIYCFGSEKLKNESELIATALYDRIPWYRLPIRLQKLLLILPQQRAQENMFLTGYIFRLERPLLVSIIRTAFSAATLLKAVQKRQLEA